jgi:hypothetical protein
MTGLLSAFGVWAPVIERPWGETPCGGRPVRDPTKTSPPAPWGQWCELAAPAGSVAHPRIVPSAAVFFCPQAQANPWPIRNGQPGVRPSTPPARSCRAPGTNKARKKPKGFRPDRAPPAARLSKRVQAQAKGEIWITATTSSGQERKGARGEGGELLWAVVLPLSVTRPRKHHSSPKNRGTTFDRLGRIHPNGRIHRHRERCDGWDQILGVCVLENARAPSPVFLTGR